MSETPPVPYVVVINPVKTGTKYKPVVRAKGYRLLSVYAFSRSLLEERWPDHAAGDDLTVYAVDTEEILTELAPHREQIKAIVPGDDSSVHLADEVAHRLGLPGNSVELSWARNHKDEMRRVAELAGLCIPRYRVVTTVDDIADAARAVGFPAIVKHSAGGGSHGAKLVPDEEALTDLDLELFDHYQLPVQKWLVEQYVRGREIAVNAMSCGGRHHIIDMWFYSQPDDSDYDFPYWNNLQISRDDPDWERVAAVVEQVLDAFGVTLGPSHTEVKCDPDQVYLIEMAARLGGGPFTDLWMSHSKFDPFADHIDCLLGRQPDGIDDISFDARFGAIAIRNEGAPGVLREIRGLAEFAAGPGVEKVLVAYQPGDLVPTTDSTRTIPLGAWVTGATGAEVEERLEYLRGVVQLDLDRSRPDA
jgi:biotin carboxylase